MLDTNQGSMASGALACKAPSIQQLTECFAPFVVSTHLFAAKSIFTFHANSVPLSFRQVPLQAQHCSIFAQFTFATIPKARGWKELRLGTHYSCFWFEDWSAMTLLWLWWYRCKVCLPHELWAIFTIRLKLPKCRLKFEVSSLQATKHRSCQAGARSVSKVGE